MKIFLNIISAAMFISTTLTPLAYCYILAYGPCWITPKPLLTTCILFSIALLFLSIMTSNFHPEGPKKTGSESKICMRVPTMAEMGCSRTDESKGEN